MKEIKELTPEEKRNLKLFLSFIKRDKELTVQDIEEVFTSELLSKIHNTPYGYIRIGHLPTLAFIEVHHSISLKGKSWLEAFKESCFDKKKRLFDGRLIYR